MRGDEEDCIASIVGVWLICLLDNSTKKPKALNMGTEQRYSTVLERSSGP